MSSVIFIFLQSGRSKMATARMRACHAVADLTLSVAAFPICLEALVQLRSEISARTWYIGAIQADCLVYKH